MNHDCQMHQHSGGTTRLPTRSKCRNRSMRFISAVGIVVVCACYDVTNVVHGFTPSAFVLPSLPQRPRFQTNDRRVLQSVGNQEASSSSTPEKATEELNESKAKAKQSMVYLNDLIENLVDAVTKYILTGNRVFWESSYNIYIKRHNPTPKTPNFVCHNV